MPRFTLNSRFIGVKEFMLQFLGSKLEYEKDKPNWLVTKYCKFNVLLICAL